MHVRLNNALAEWAGALMQEHGNLSLRQAEIRTGVHYGTVKGLLEGRQPNAETIIRFALGFNASVPEALRVAGFDDLAHAWETGAAPLVLHPARNNHHQCMETVDPVLKKAHELHEKVVLKIALIPFGPEREAYKEKLRTEAEANWNLIEARLKAEEERVK